MYVAFLFQNCCCNISTIYIALNPYLVMCYTKHVSWFQAHNSTDQVLPSDVDILQRITNIYKLRHPNFFQENSALFNTINLFTTYGYLENHLHQLNFRQIQ